MTTDEKIQKREDELRAWFTRSLEGPRKIVDGLDIGWGGVQHWATARMPDIGSGVHLDFACGYATFLAELGWRFPQSKLTGLNIDFKGPHALATPLLNHARVQTKLVQGDACEMPFENAAFNSVSCFLGLQDIELVFGMEGVYRAIREAVRVLQPSGHLYLLDEYSFEMFSEIINELPLMMDAQMERELDVKWDQETANCAIDLYSQGWVKQKSLGRSQIPRKAREEYAQKMWAEAERQFSTRGYYVPFGPIRMVSCRVDSHLS
jgi:ubiquinone/menaquinone biosynthesis C-methylase UbiE